MLSNIQMLPDHHIVAYNLWYISMLFLTQQGGRIVQGFLQVREDDAAFRMLIPLLFRYGHMVMSLALIRPRLTDDWWTVTCSIQTIQEDTFILAEAIDEAVRE